MKIVVNEYLILCNEIRDFISLLNLTIPEDSLVTECKKWTFKRKFLFQIFIFIYPNRNNNFRQSESCELVPLMLKPDLGNLSTTSSLLSSSILYVLSALVIL